MAGTGTRNRRFRSADTESTQNFGEVLRSTREKHGISIREVAGDLKIREDILHAIEQGDFSRIPPQGYSRNMIKSYARLLGLNANKITDAFLDAEYSYQLSKKQASAKQISEENLKRVPNVERVKKKSTMTPREQIEMRKAERQKQGVVEEEAQFTSPFKQRTMHVYGNKYKNTPRARRELDTGSDVHRGRSSLNTEPRFSRDFLDGGSYSSARERLDARRAASLIQDPNEQSEAEQKKKHRSRSGYQFMNVYQKKNNAAQSNMQIPIIVGSVIALIIILILVFFFVGKQNENDKTDVSKLNVVGITDIEKSDNSQGEGDEEKVVNEPKEVEFKYKVKEGSTVYMEIYENDSNRPTLAREVKSGETNTFKVTGKLKVVTSQPDGVEFYVADQKVEPVDTKGNGVYDYTVDFNEYLTKWRSQNATKRISF